MEQEPACLMPSVSYNNQMKQANHEHACRGAVTFGMIMSESLGGDNWADVPKKCYVEEAKSYTQPGSVAEKKAFFEAYYKKIAAEKAAAAALLEQEKAAAAAAAAANTDHQVSYTDVDFEIVKTCTKNAEPPKIKNLEDHEFVSVSKTERPLLKSKLKADEVVTQPMIKNKPAISSWVASAHHRKDKFITPRTKKVTTNNYTDRSLAPKSLRVLMNSSFEKESCTKTRTTKPASSVHSTPKRDVTPVKTPAKLQAVVNGVDKQPLGAHSVNRRIETPVHPTVAESKSIGPKWHILSAFSKSFTAYRSKLKSPTVSSPFVLRTEDRAARRKQKLEEKFNERQAQVLQQKTQSKEKTETEFRKMLDNFHFKALPLPEFYKGRESPKKVLEPNAKSSTPRRKTSSSAYPVKKMSSKRLWKNSNQDQVSLLAGVISHENMSPNTGHCIS